MDGLLFDTERLYEEAAISAAASMGREMTSAFFRSTIGLPWPAVRTRVLGHYGAAFEVDELEERSRRHFRARVDAHLPLKPGVVDLLDLLDELGLPRAIATSSSQATVRHHLAAHDLAERFHHVVAHGDCPRHKPAPDPYLTAAERLGIAPQACLALEDSFNGVRSASAAGMMTVMVPDLMAPTDEIRGLCVHVAADLHEVGSMVEALARETGR
jgi:HAD superfamily hydrolase (TIGR01509 family)